jgi:hypothetical protein
VLGGSKDSSNSSKVEVDTSVFKGMVEDDSSGKVAVSDEVEDKNSSYKLFIFWPCIRYNF